MGYCWRVVGLEREPLFAEMAHAEIAKRGLSNVRVVQADALNTGREKSAYDLVHARLVLINVSARDSDHSWQKCYRCFALAVRSPWRTWTVCRGSVTHRTRRGMFSILRRSLLASFSCSPGGRSQADT